MAPTTKDGKHEVVFPDDFCYDHGTRLRSALEGRVTWELLRIGREEPPRAERINQNYAFQFGSKFPLDDKHGVLTGITIPHVARIVQARRGVDPSWPGWEGDLFDNAYKPITINPYHPTYNSLVPIECDSGNVFTKGRCNLREYEKKVPGLEELEKQVIQSEVYKSGEGGVGFDMYDKLREVFKGNIINIANNEQASEFLRNRSLYFVMFSLAESRLASERPESWKHFFRNTDANFFPPVNASPEFVRKIAADSEALCLEYLSEMGKSDPAQPLTK